MYARQCDWCGKIMPSENYYDYVNVEVSRDETLDERHHYYHLCNKCYDKFKKIKVE